MLRVRVEDMIADRSDLNGFYPLLADCIQDGTVEGLACVRRMLEFTSLQLQAPAACALMCWGTAGADALHDALLGRREGLLVSFGLELLSCIASGSTLPPLSFIFGEIHNVTGPIEAARRTARGLPGLCRAHLVDLVLSFSSDDDLAEHAGRAISNLSMAGSAATRELFLALSSRWLAISKPILTSYDTLLAEHGDDEVVFQNLLAAHPQLLDPMAVQVWTKANLYGARFPDFVVRRSDDTYCVIEIETPIKSLITSECQLSAFVTHAEAQVIDYRDFLMRRFFDVRHHFPHFDDPDCLVVVGLERALTPPQRGALQAANRQRHRVRIVGFDWLSDRARRIVTNVTHQLAAAASLRVF